MENRWTLREVLRLWEQFRVVSDFTGMRIEGIHSFVFNTLNQIQSLRDERDKYRERAFAAENRLEDIIGALSAHTE